MNFLHQDSQLVAPLSESSFHDLGGNFSMMLRHMNGQLKKNRSCLSAISCITVQGWYFRWFFPLHLSFKNLYVQTPWELNTKKILTQVFFDPGTLWWNFTSF